MSFDDLSHELAAAVESGLINTKVHPVLGLTLYTYSRQCVFDRAWDHITGLARGLILDLNNKKVVATPFPKFFNLGEMHETIPDLPFETFEKLDGSLIIIYHYGDQWHCATKGSFFSEQAVWAQQLVRASTFHSLSLGTTYLAEAIYPENRIVIHYPQPMLALLGAYDETGRELAYHEIKRIAERSPFEGDYAERHEFKHVSEIPRDLPSDREGFVIRFNNGHRLKIKGDAYLRLHRCISRVTPLAVWEMMRDKEDLTAFKRDLPEEFWTDFENILSALYLHLNRIKAEVRRAVEMCSYSSDKQVGLRMDEFGPIVRKLIFPARKGNMEEGRARLALYGMVRPNANHLEGYTPSSSIERVHSDGCLP